MEFNELALETLFVPVPGGTFIMGANFDEYIDEEVREYPKRSIELSDFEIQKTPVTVGIWKVFLSQTDYDWEFNEILVSPTNLSPIVYVSWTDCMAFISWIQDEFGGYYSCIQLG